MAGTVPAIGAIADATRVARRAGQVADVAKVRYLGIAGEQAVGVGSKSRIPSLTGTAAYRIPDILTNTTLGEVKNVKSLSLTRQLVDFHLFAQKNNLDFVLYTRQNTILSKQLQNLINSGSIIHKTIPFK